MITWVCLVGNWCRPFADYPGVWKRPYQRKHLHCMEHQKATSFGRIGHQTSAHSKRSCTTNFSVSGAQPVELKGKRCPSPHSEPLLVVEFGTTQSRPIINRFECCTRHAAYLEKNREWSYYSYFIDCYLAKHPPSFENSFTPFKCVNRQSTMLMLCNMDILCCCDWKPQSLTCSQNNPQLYTTITRLLPLKTSPSILLEQASCTLQRLRTQRSPA